MHSTFVTQTQSRFNLNLLDMSRKEEAKKAIAEGNSKKLMTMFSSRKEDSKTLRRAPSTQSLDQCPKCSKISKLNHFVDPLTGKSTKMCGECLQRFQEKFGDSDFELARALQAQIDRQIEWNSQESLNIFSADQKAAIKCQKDLDAQMAKDLARQMKLDEILARDKQKEEEEAAIQIQNEIMDDLKLARSLQENLSRENTAQNATSLIHICVICGKAAIGHIDFIEFCEVHMKEQMELAKEP